MTENLGEPSAAEAAVNAMLAEGISAGASDWHICEGTPITVRVNGKLRRTKSIAPAGAVALLQDLCAAGDEQRNLRIRALYNERGYHNGALMAQGRRFRIQTFRSLGRPCAAVRLVDATIRTLSQIGVPALYSSLIRKEYGLILVCGATGSGKSTTLNATIDEFNRSSVPEDAMVIHTAESPVEFQHESKNCTIFQSEVGPGEDLRTYAEASEVMLRRDPDIVVFGEMLDLPTVEQAMRLAGSGHLVFGTMHSATASGAVEQVLQLFPEKDKEFYRGMLSQTFIGAAAQVLVDAIGGGRMAAFDILQASTAVANFIVQGKPQQLRGHMQSTTMGPAAKSLTRDHHLMGLVEAKIISPSTAIQWALERETMERKIAEAKFILT